MAQVKVAFVDIKEFDKNFLEKNKPENCEFIYFKEPIHDFESLEGKIEDVEVLSVFTSSRVRAEFLEKFKNLKLVTTRSTGFSHIDLAYCKEKGIPVVNVPRYGEVTVAEFTFGLLLNVIRKINIAYENLQEGIINIQGYMGNDLEGKTLGVIGTGAIGCHAIKIANGFGMNVIANDPYPKQEFIDKFGVKYVSLDELYRNSDIITLHCPSTKENHHMLNDEAFSKMKDGVVIVNTARGEIIDTEALYKALIKGKVAGAGLDVLECEEIISGEDDFLLKIDCIKPECLARTLINHRLLELPNVIVTPHVAFDSVEAVQRILATTIGNIKKYLEGNVQNRVN